MNLLLTVDGRECPGCDSHEHFCQGTATAIFTPAGIHVDDLIQGIEQIFGKSNAFGRVSNSTFYLDPAQIVGLSPNKVIQLLTATGNALARLGHRADINKSIAVANQILKI